MPGPVRRLAGSLFAQTVLALLLGTGFALLAPDAARGCRLLGDLFLRLVSLVVCPLVFCVVVQGILGAGTLVTVRRVGLKALLYFELVTTAALGLGVASALLFRPGIGLHVSLAALDPAAIGHASLGAETLMRGGIGAFLLALVPASPVDAFARNDVLQVLVLAVLIGVALSRMGETARPLLMLIDTMCVLTMQVMRMVVRLAPLGVFGAIGFTVASFGLATLERLMLFVLVYCGAVLLFVLVGLGLVLRLCGLGVIRFLLFLRQEILVVAATTSSDAVLPQVMEKLQRLGIRREVVGLVIPAGYSFNLDALSLYLGLAVPFLAQVAGVHPSLQQTLLVLGVSLVTAKGAHGIPGVGIVILAATISVLPQIPPVSLVLLLSIDWFVGIPRAVGNMIGNCVATVVVAAWENELDPVQARAVLGGLFSGGGTGIDGLRPGPREGQGGAPLEPAQGGP